MGNKEGEKEPQVVIFKDGHPSYLSHHTGFSYNMLMIPPEEVGSVLPAPSVQVGLVTAPTNRV